jgi:hypothetical protein
MKSAYPAGEEALAVAVIEGGNKNCSHSFKNLAQRYEQKHIENKAIFYF